MRTCAKCKQSQPLAAFNKYFAPNGRPKGRKYICASCDFANEMRLAPVPIDGDESAVGIRLTRGEMAIIDREDAQRVLAGRWSTLTPNPGAKYAVRLIDGRYTMLHRFILGAKSGEEVDHLNGDGLDCRKCNLRITSSRINKWNQSLPRTNRSGFKGVYLRSDTGKWAARLSIHNRNVALGCFDTAEEAARRYDEALRAEAGHDGRYNFPLPGESGFRTGKP